MNEIKKIQQLYIELCKVVLKPFAEKGGVKETNKHGVYIIYNARNKVLHVGKTNRGKNGLDQRLTNHLRGQSSFYINYLKPNNIDLRKGCKYRYIQQSNARKRTLLEGLVTGKLCPAYIGTGDNKKVK